MNPKSTNTFGFYSIKTLESTELKRKEKHCINELFCVVEHESTSSLFTISLSTSIFAGGKLLSVMNKTSNFLIHWQKIT